MKIKIDELEIEFTAKDNLMNREYTELLINDLERVYSYLADYISEEGRYHALERKYYRIADQLHNILVETGFYKGDKE